MAERLGMVIDMKGCVACASCAVACKVENNGQRVPLWRVRLVHARFCQAKGIHMPAPG